jgi:predicted DNA-binding transcriptional regulator AlpA
MLSEEPNAVSPGSQQADASSNHDSPPEVMTMEEAAKFLCISTRTLDRYVREAAVPYTPLPRRGARVRVLFLRSQLITWLRQRTIKPDRENSRSIRA